MKRGFWQCAACESENPGSAPHCLTCSVERDADELRHMGVERVIVAERQLSNELVRHALRRFGISDREISAIVERRP